MFTIEDEDDVMAVLTAQRDQIVRELTKQCGNGRLTLDELETRIEEAYAASSTDELRLVLRELPTDDTVLDAPKPVEPAPVRRDRLELPPLPDLPKIDLPHRRNVDPEWHKPVGMLFTIGGFVLLFNGMFWLALLCWFVLPGLVMQKKACR
jgi:hypothetical protein